MTPTIRHRSPVGAVVLVLLLALTQEAAAQRYHAVNLRARDGLPCQDVRALLQHPDGSVWMGTRTLLLRYDGYGLTTVWEPTNARIPSLLAVDPDGIVWSADRRLSMDIMRHDGNVSETIAPPPVAELQGCKVSGLEIMPNGWLAVISVGSGVHLRDHEGRWTRPPGGPIGKLRSATVTPDGLFVAGEDGLSRLRNGRWALGVHVAAGLPDESLLTVARGEGEGKRLWIAGTDWVGWIEGKHGAVLRRSVDLDLSDRHRRDGRKPKLLPDGAGGVWFTTSSLLARVDLRGDIEQFGESAGLAGEGANDLMRDRDQNTWIATSRGVSRIPSLRFLNLDKRDGLLSDEISALLEHPDGRLIVGHNYGLSQWVDGEVEVIVPRPEGLGQADELRVMDMAVDHEGTVWMARALGGIQILDGRQCVRVPLTWKGEDVNVSGVSVGPDGTVWLGTSAGIWRRQGDTFERVAIPVEGDHVYARRVFPFEDEVWVATSAFGLLHGKDGVWTQVAHPDIATANSVFAVHRQADGRVFAGTRDGLYEVSGSELVRPEGTGLAVLSPIYSFLQAPGGPLWIGTQAGLIRWDGSERRSYGVAQGLPGLEFNRGAALIDSQGRPWFGTVGGLTQYRAEYDDTESERRPPSVSLGDLTLRGSTYALDEEHELQADQDDLVFGFHAVTFLDVGEVGFRYRLQGHDEGWLELAAPGSAVVRYAGLPSGHYTFHVKARSPAGEWSEEATSASIQLLRPWWQQTWFRVLVAALILALGTVVVHQLGQRRRAAELELLVLQRTRALSAAEQRYRVMFDRNGTAQVLVSPKDGLVLAANPAADREWEVRTGTLVHRRLDELLHEPSAESLARLLAPRAEEDASTAAHRQAGGGSVRDLEIEACAYEFEYDVAVHLTVRDVTERNQVEAQLAQAQKMESVGRLAGGVAHDFNNMLTAVLGHAEQARRQLHDHDAADEHLTELVSAARRGARLTSQLLGFAREQTTHPVVLNPCEFLDSLHSLLSRVVRDDVVLDLVRDPTAGNVSMDPVQLEQVVINLVVNGTDAMPDGGRLVVGVAPGTPDDNPREGSEPEEWVRIWVSDTGTGMTDEVLGRVFEPFFSTKPPARGTGLGLATTHGILRQNGGLIEVATETGAGSTFHVLLPRVEQPATTVLGASDGAPAASPPPARTESTERTRPATILLVEDEPIVRDVATTALRREGHEVLEAEDGRTALELFDGHEGSIDLLLTDVIMPGMSGRELAERLLLLRPELAVLFTSGYTAQELPDLDGRPGEGALLSKPYRLEELQAAVADALAGPGASLPG
jgi:signal transduction histidine kinase/ligand-binding sensor domain-containing protein/CheY-like chemotaxis protein